MRWMQRRRSLTWNVRKRFDAGKGRPELCVPGVAYWLAQIPVPRGKMYRIIRREDGNPRLSSRWTGIWSVRPGRLGDRGTVGPWDPWDRGKGTPFSLRFPVSTSRLQD